MNSKNNLLVIAVLGVIIIGGAIFVLRKPSDRNLNPENGVYDNLNSEILEFLSDFDAQTLSTNSTDEVLTVELFELDPENQELGEIS